MLSINKFPTWWLLLATGTIFFFVGILSFLDPLNSYLKLVKFTPGKTCTMVLPMKYSSNIHTITPAPVCSTILHILSCNV